VTAVAVEGKEYWAAARLISATPVARDCRAFKEVQG